MKVTRSFVWDALLVIALLLTVPPEVQRFWHTGHVYLFSPQFYADLLARFQGTGRLRFLFQPATAVILGARSGLKDARAGRPAFLWSLLFRADDRAQAWRSALAASRDLVAFAILLDLVAQALLLPAVRPAASLVIGPLMIGVPYALARALANRLTPRRGTQQHRAAA